MNPSHPRPDPRELLAHAAWLEDLARHLVGPGAAQDLVQDTYTIALRRAPVQEASLRAWLATVLRRLSRDRLRGEANRRARNEEAARAEALAGSDETVARAEVQRLVLNAVLALDEPYRGTVLLRYFEGHAAAEIARRQNVPAATVRSRLARGLAQLRADLDRRHGGDGASWVQALAPVVGTGAGLGGGAGLLAGASIMKVLVLSVCAAAGVLGLGGYLSLREAPRSAAPMARGVVPAGTIVPVGRAAAMPADSPDELPAQGTPRTEATAVVAAPATGATLVGRLFLPGGGPAQDVALSLSGQPLRARAAASWRKLEGASGPDGRFEFAFDPRPVRTIELRAEAPGLVARRWTWATVPPGERLDLGDVELERAAVLEVRIVDAQGRAAGLDWSVQLEGVAARLHRSQRVDADAGLARLEGLAAGAYTLTAWSPEGESIPARSIELLAGERREVELVDEGPSPAERIVVSPRLAEGIHSLQLAEGSFVLRGEGVALRSRLSGSPRTSLRQHVFDGLAPGFYEVRIDAPCFEPWGAVGIAPGEILRPRLRGTAALALEVVDGVSGRNREDYKLLVSLQHTDPSGGGTWLSSSNRWGPEDGPPPGHLYTGLPCAALVLHVEVPGAPARELREPALAPGETRRVRVEFFESARLTGLVTDAGGRPIGGAFVQVGPAGSGPVGETEQRFSGGGGREDRRSQVSSAPDGTFVLEGLQPGRVAVHAFRDAWQVASADDLDLVAGETREVALALPVAARLEGRVRDASPAQGTHVASWATGIVLIVTPRAALRVSDRYRLPLDHFLVPIGADGSFASGPLPAGSAALSLLASGSVVRPDGARERADVFHSELELVAGEVLSLELDLAPFRPGALHLQAASPLPASRGEFPRIQARRVGDPFAARGARFDASGQARIGPLLPGEYELALQSPGSSAFQALPGVVRVGPGESVRLTVPVAPALATLRAVVDPSGAPLAGRTLGLRSPHGGGRRVSLDERGEARIELLPGPYFARLLDSDGRTAGKEIEFTWTPAGPAPDPLRIPKPD